jgi:hypothetical protein
LGEALSLRAKKAQQLDELKQRVLANILTQEGEDPAEDPDALISEFERVSDELSELVEKIARTNIERSTSDGENLLTLLHRRETLRRKRNLLSMVANQATPTQNQFRWTRTEIKFVTTIDVQARRQAIDELDQEIRALDSKLQETNWQVDLV